MELDNNEYAVLVVATIFWGAFWFNVGVIHAGETASTGFDEVYFLSGDGPNKTIGFYNPNQSRSITCTINMQDQVKIADDAYRYSELTECRSFDGSLQERWHNESFESFNVYDRVKCMRRTGNRTKCIP